MGIDIHSSKFLKSEWKRGVNFERTLTLGHQAVYMDEEKYRSLIASLGFPCNDMAFSDDFFHALGAKILDVMDVSSYEGANILHDLNESAGHDLFEKYDCIFDGGALEHVFNLPQALKNCMEMVKIGGHFITISPANAFCGHGFYQFSPEFFYGALSCENGYAVEHMLFIHRGQWYSVRKPSEVKERIELFTTEPTLLFVSAKRCERKPIFAKWPQQSDYSVAWKAEKSIAPTKGTGFTQKILKSSSFARKLLERWKNFKHRKKRQPSNREWFVPVNVD